MTLADVARLLVILAGAFMVVLDFFIVLVALPSIAFDLAATPGQLQLIVAGYGVANAAGLIAGGKLGDLLGRRRMFLIGMALFGITSVACGLSTSGLMLVVARFAQGTAGALLHPQVLALLGLNFPGDKRARAFAAYAMAMGLAGVAGQLLGGALIEINFAQTGWRSCFFINAPVALAAIALGLKLLDRETPPASARQLDLWGMALTAGALTCLIVPLTYGRESLSGLVNGVLLVAAAVLAAAFVRSQRRRAARGLAVMVPPQWWPRATSGSVWPPSWCSIAASRRSTSCSACTCSTTLALSALQSAAGVRDPRRRLLDRVDEQLDAGPRAETPAGRSSARWCWLPATCCRWRWPPAVAVSRWRGSRCWSRAPASGFVMAPLVSLALSRLPSQHAGVAAGILSTMQSTGNALGVAVVGFFYIAGLWLPAGSVYSATRASSKRCCCWPCSRWRCGAGATHPGRGRQAA